MKEEHLVVITAFFSIVGIVITTLSSHSLWKKDYNIKQREQTIDALKTFYLPLAKQMNILKAYLQDYLKNNTINSLLAVLAKQEDADGENVRLVQLVKTCVNEILQIMPQRVYVDDYILYYYCDIIDDYITMFDKAINDCEVPESVDINIDAIEKFKKRTEHVYIKACRKNIFGGIYLIVWKLFHTKN